MSEPAYIPQAEPNGHGSRNLAVVPAQNGSVGTWRGAYGAADAPEQTSSFALQMREFLRILFRRKWLIASVALAVLTVGLVRTLMEVPLYAATVRLQIDPASIKVVENGSTAPMDNVDYDFQRTQIELLLSRSIAERAASALHLGSNDAFFRSRAGGVSNAIKRLIGWTSNPDASRPQNSANDHAAAGVILGSRSVQPINGSRMVDVTFLDPDPQRAQQVVTAIADAFIAANLDKRFQANAYAKTYLEDRIQQLKIKLEQSEKAMLEFAEKEQIVVVTERASAAETNLNAANASLSALAQDRIKAEELWRQIQSNNVVNVPQFIDNKAIADLRAKRSALSTEYQQKLETFKPSYPAMMEISNQIADIDKQIASEVKAIRSSLKANFESVSQQEEVTRQRIDTLKSDLLDLQKRSIQYNLLKREVDSTRTLYDGLLQRFKEVDVAAGVGANNVFIVDKAEVPGGPVSPQVFRALLISAVFGLGIAFLLAYIIEFFDDSISSAEELERASGLAILGIIPRVVGGSSLEHEIGDLRSHVSESFRSLATALQLSTDGGLPKSLLLTSSGPAEGKSSSSLALARHFATMGMKILLIDADMRNPSMHKKLGTDNGVGLSTYLTGQCSPPDALQATTVPNLAFMASGPLPPNAADLLSSPRLNSLVAVGNEVFDCIIFDGPPVMGIADAQLLANVSSATLMVVGAGQTRSGSLKGALRRLQMGRSPVLGAILNKYDIRNAGYEYTAAYGYGYGYGYRYAPVEAADAIAGAVPSTGRLANAARSP